MSDHRKVLMNAMSRMMLEGWGMSQSICPRDGCGTPLLKNRQGELYCSNCDMRVVIERTPEDDDEQEEVAVRPRARLPAGVSAVRSTAEAASGDKAVAPVASSVSASSSGAAAIPAAAAAVAAPTPTAPAPAPRPRPSTDSASQRLGAKLIAGWRMLADSCPQCGIPFMQPRNEARKQCVGCETWVPLDGTPAASVPAASASAPAASAVSGGALPSPVTPQLAPAANGTAATHGHPDENLDGYDDSDDDEEARQLQLRLMEQQRQRAAARAAQAVALTASPNTSTSGPTSGPKTSATRSEGEANPWAAALSEVSAIAAADEAGGIAAAQSARASIAASRSRGDNGVAAGGGRSASPSSAPAAAVSRPLIAARILRAPARWDQLSEEQLRQAVAAATTGSGSSSSSTAAVSSASARGTPMHISNSSSTPATRTEGDVGPSGVVQQLGSIVYTVEEPDEQRVRRMALALERAHATSSDVTANGTSCHSNAGYDSDEEANALAARVLGRPLSSVCPTTTAAASAPPARPSAAHVTRPTAPALSAQPQPLTVESQGLNSASRSMTALPAGTDDALAALISRLEADNAAIAKLGAEIEGEQRALEQRAARCDVTGLLAAQGRIDCATEAMANAAVRVAKLAQGIEALRRLYTQS